MATKARKKTVPRRRRVHERRRKPRVPEDAAPQAPELDRATARGLEVLTEEEDDFADGRSSAGRAMRADEDAWGRGLAPEERPFEEEDVPPRAGKLPRSEPAPEPEEPDVET